MGDSSLESQVELTEITMSSDANEKSTSVRPDQNFSLKTSDIQAADIVNWHPVLSKYTCKVVKIPIAKNVLEYLRDNGTVLLPEYNLNKLDGDDSWASGPHSDDEERQLPSFPEFDQLVESGIEKLGGTVFIKLNWSAPIDATWASANQLKVSHPLHVWQLLKCSDRIQFDIERPFSYCNPPPKPNESLSTPHLILKPHKPIAGGSEYRCFIRQGRVLAITQRDIRAFYEYMVNNMDSTGKRLNLFIAENIVPRLREKLSMENFVLDVSIGNPRDIAGTTTVVDVNPFSNCQVDSLLFDWEQELLNPNVRQFWESTDILLEGVKSEPIYDWLGFCGFIRCRLKKNFSPSQYLQNRMSEDLNVKL